MPKNQHRRRQRSRRDQARRQAQLRGPSMEHGRSLFVWNFARNRSTGTFDPDLGVDNALAATFQRLPECTIDIWPTLIERQALGHVIREHLPRDGMIGDEVVVDLFCEHLRGPALAMYGILNELPEDDPLRLALFDPDEADLWLALIFVPHQLPACDV